MPQDSDNKLRGLRFSWTFLEGLIKRGSEAYALQNQQGLPNWRVICVKKFLLNERIIILSLSLEIKLKYIVEFYGSYRTVLTVLIEATTCFRLDK